MDALSLARIRTALIAVPAVFCAGLILIHAKSVIQPLLLAFFACLILNPLVKKLEALLSRRLRVPARASPFVAAAAALLLAALLLVGLGLVFYANLAPMVREWPRLLERGTQHADAALAALRGLGVERATWETLDSWTGESDLAGKVRSQLAAGPALAFLTGGVTSFLGFLGQAFLVLVYTVFMLFEAADYRAKAERVFGEKSALVAAVEQISQKIQVYLAVKTVMSLVTGAATALICLAFGVPFALFWGVLAFGINYVPYVGSIVAVVCPALMGLFASGHPLASAALLVSLSAMQTAIGTFLEPRVMGSRMSLSPLILLVSLAVWGWLWGVVGMILSAVFAATLQLAMREHPYFKQWSKMMDAKASDRTRVLEAPPAAPAPAGPGGGPGARVP